jgi:hypothetical protein
MTQPFPALHTGLLSLRGAQQEYGHQVPPQSAAFAVQPR